MTVLRLLAIAWAAAILALGVAPARGKESDPGKRERLSIALHGTGVSLEAERRADERNRVRVRDGQAAGRGLSFSGTLALGIRAYQVLLSSQDRPSCQFVPSCSRYCIGALREYGALAGALRCSDRVQRCHPYASISGRYPLDPVTGRAVDAPVGSVAPASDAGAKRPGPDQLRPAGSALDAATPRPGAFDPSSVEAFADFLHDEGDCSRAASEYARAWFSSGLDADSLAYKAGVSLRTCEERDDAVRWLLAVGSGNGADRLDRAAAYQLCYALLEQAEPQLVDEAVSGGWGPCGTLAEVDQAYLLLASRIARLDWEGATALCEAGPATSPDATLGVARRRLCELSKEALNAPRRDPGLALMLSTFVPGSGKLYAGRPLDGVASLLSVAAPTYVAYRSFERDGEDSFAGWAYSAAAAVFYLGNVYGSYHAAEETNARVNERYRRRGLRAFLEFHPGGIGMRGEFDFSLP